MTQRDYLAAVRTHLRGVPRTDRERALAALSAQLDELADAGISPDDALGGAAEYARRLTDALAGGGPTDARWRVLGLPVDLRGPVSAQVRSRTWDPADPRVFVPRLFGIGWTLNLGAVAVRLRLLRPDDTGADVLGAIPPRALRRSAATPLVVAGATAAAVAFSWRTLPATVATGFGPDGRARDHAPRGTLIAGVALGLVPAVWAQRRDAPTEDRLVRAATATSLAAISAGAVAAILAEARRPGGRWGLLTVAALPLAVAASLAVVVVPLRAGLRRAWRAAQAATATTGPIRTEETS